MPRCPSCADTVAADARFCSNCGARLTQDAAAPRADSAPHGPDDRRTITLPAPGVAPTARLPELPASGPAGDTRPTAAYPIPQISQPQQPGARSNLWLVLGLVAALGLVTLVALVLGVALLIRENSAAGQSAAVAAPTARATTTPRATAAPQPTAGLAAFDTVLLHDTFDRAGGSSLTEDDTDTVSYAFVDGAYAITLKQPNYIVWSPFAGVYDTASAQVDATLDTTKENAAGLVFRYQDEQNFYVFLIASDQSYDLELYKQDKLTTLIDWTESETIKRAGEPNRLRVEMTGDLIRLFVNDRLLDEISDDTFSKGQMALAATTFDKGNATATFDNLVVRGSK